MRFLYKLKESEKFKKILFLGLQFSLLLYIFSLPSFGERTGAIHYLIYGTMVILGLIVLLYSFLYKKIKINKAMFTPLPFVLFAFVGTLIFSKNFRNWLTVLLLFFSFIIFLLSFVIIDDVNRVFSIISIAFFAFSIYFIWHYRSDLLNFSLFKSGYFRLGSYFDNENAVAFYASIGFSISLYLVLFSKYKFRFLYLISCLSCLIVGVTTGSRTFYLLILIVSYVYCFFLFRKHKWIFLISSIVVIGGFIGVLYLPFMGTVRDRFISAFETLFGTTARPDTSTTQRFVFMDYGFFLGSKNAILGYGCGGFLKYSGVGTYAHSNYAETLCDFGLFGFLLFYIPLFLPLVYSYVYKMRKKQVIYSLIIFFIIFGISNVFYSSKIYYLLLATLHYVTFFDGHKNIENQQCVTSLRKVTIVCDSMNAGGAERVISNLSNQFCHFGLRVSIITTSNDTKCFYNIDKRIEMHSLQTNKKGVIRPFYKFIKLITCIKNIKPDVVISFLPHVNVYSWFACKLLKIPHIVSERNDPYRDPKNKLLKFFKNQSFLYADGCVFQTNSAKDYYCEEINKKSTVIMNPVSIDNKLVPSTKKEKMVVAVGRLNEQKNYKFLFDSFSIFNKKHSGYKLKIYGTGELELNLKKYCESLELANIEFLGVNPNWIQDSINASCFVLSSEYEGMPNALLEALCSGIPCISTNCPIGVPQELKNRGFDIQLVGLGDIGDFVQKFEKIITKECAVNALSNREKASLFNLSLIANEWITFIKSIKRQSLF